MGWDRLIGLYIKYLKEDRGLSETSVNIYVKNLKIFNAFINGELGTIKPGEITSYMISDFLSSKKHRGLSDTSLLRFSSSLNLFFKYLLKVGVVDTNPMDKVAPIRIEKKTKEILTVEEIDAIINAIDLDTKHGLRDRAIVELLYSCGLRASELVNLKIRDIHFNESIIKVIGYAEKERYIPIPDIALKELRRYLNIERKSLLQGLPEIESVFVNNKGKQLSRVMVFYIVKRLGEKAGIKKKVCPNIFRHSLAFHLIENGADIRAVKQMFGHTSLLTTESYL